MSPTGVAEEKGEKCSGAHDSANAEQSQSENCLSVLKSASFNTSGSVPSSSVVEPPDMKCVSEVNKSGEPSKLLESSRVDSIECVKFKRTSNSDTPYCDLHQSKKKNTKKSSSQSLTKFRAVVQSYPGTRQCASNSSASNDGKKQYLFLFPSAVHSQLYRS